MARTSPMDPEGDGAKGRSQIRAGDTGDVLESEDPATQPGIATAPFDVFGQGKQSTALAREGRDGERATITTPSVVGSDLPAPFSLTASLDPFQPQSL